MDAWIVILFPHGWATSAAAIRLSVEHTDCINLVLVLNATWNQSVIRNSELFYLNSEQTIHTVATLQLHTCSSKSVCGDKSFEYVFDNFMPIGKECLVQYIYTYISYLIYIEIHIMYFPLGDSGFITKGDQISSVGICSRYHWARAIASC